LSFSVPLVLRRLMASVTEHYEQLLAPVYLWMAGGADAALAEGTAELAGFLPTSEVGAAAIDLGAGFGMHSIPLARAGYEVAAVDSSRTMLGELTRLAAGTHVRTIECDMLEFRTHVGGKAALIVCMGDTLTHLPDVERVERLFAEIAAALAPGGRLVMTFRDYTTSLARDARFIPVRSDAERIHTCFLEEGATHVRVHDLIHERREGSWHLRVGSYDKLRLSPAWVVAALGLVGRSARAEPGARGMVRVVV
jgi:SAM-dependent methyltransferase